MKAKHCSAHLLLGFSGTSSNSIPGPSSAAALRRLGDNDIGNAGAIAIAQALPGSAVTYIGCVRPPGEQRRAR